MNCIYCNKPVYGAEGISIPGHGPAHQSCFKVQQSLRRTFRGLDISALEDQELVDLQDLVLAEINARSKKNGDDDVELF